MPGRLMKNRTFEEARSLLGSGLGGCPPSHTPVATLTIKLVCTRRAETLSVKSPVVSRAFTAIFCVAVVLLLFVVSSGVALGMSYVDSQLTQRLQELHRDGCQDSVF